MLEDGLRSLQPGKQEKPAAWSERMNSDNSIVAPVSPEVNNYIASKINSNKNEEKKKASVRKKHDTDFVMQMCQKILICR